MLHGWTLAGQTSYTLLSPGRQENISNLTALVAIKLLYWMSICSFQQPRGLLVEFFAWGLSGV